VAATCHPEEAAAAAAHLQEAVGEGEVVFPDRLAVAAAEEAVAAVAGVRNHFRAEVAAEEVGAVLAAPLHPPFPEEVAVVAEVGAAEAAREVLMPRAAAALLRPELAAAL